LGIYCKKALEKCEKAEKEREKVLITLAFSKKVWYNNDDKNGEKIKRG